MRWIRRFRLNRVHDQERLSMVSFMLLHEFLKAFLDYIIPGVMGIWHSRLTTFQEWHSMNNKYCAVTCPA